MNGDQVTEPGFIELCKKLLSNSLTVVQQRVELINIELLEERSRLLTAIFLVSGVMIFILMMFLMLTLGLLLLCDENYRLMLVGILFLVYLGLGAICFYLLLKQIYRKTIFSTTLNELRKDQECLG
ncbi:MAG: hypothetical protein A2381_11585 [Bdellovibrionales bacterium RIFOXYB1_FULL_37_110]|nr:MAG: hypothetical protein A2417_11890 [Bdellovibrionales bacterium RIFOXYC1_FULL_37_79]OFZ57332.1 MAG: hypothetical protein A2381_11585 [Bdellovibrionales bacterium RIFOXYB1_FULL_37_110]OFZ62228.1 MAG: hypothetical protein A2577_14135 [Bdellovibrionales bacterium RIFOXYD1_FULL_36_51]